MKLMAGNTLLIPTGWIHAVYTPVDSMVFGGNYFHNLNIPLQLRIYDLEKKTSCESKYMFEKFEEVHWFAARMLATELKKLNVSKTKVPEYLLTGVKALIGVMKIWNSSPTSIKSIPKEIDSNGLIRTMSKEVRLAEKLINSSQPPKQGRESKRKRKKPVHDDFISSSMLSQLLPSPFKVKKKTRKFDENLMSSKTSSVSRPPLKLTLPKPVTYPYCSLPKEIPDNSIKTEVNNKEWVVSKDSNTKNNKDGLVVKLCSKLSSNVKSDWSINSLQLHKVDPEKMATKEIENTFGRFANKQSVSSVKQKNLSASNKFTEVLHTCYQEKPRETSVIAMNGQSSNFCSFLKFDTSSVYDFHESSDEEKDDNRLTIDEEPNKVLLNKLHKPKKNLHSTYFDGAVVQNKSSMNGIENLLKASSFTRDRNNIDDIEAGRASPATRDAVAGILSISQSCYGSSSNSESESSSQKGSKIKFLNEEDEEMIKVHQDDEFVYTPLDSSDDDDIKWTGKISKKSYDEAWNPKARVGPVAPKTDRPCREGTKKQAVEKGLEAAAAKKAGMPPPKRTYIRKKLKLSDKEIRPKICKTLVPSTSTGNPKGFMGIQQNSDLPKKKRKGMATPKQRLGKILKIKT
uniref:JmjC domain-containing protein n=1 Tax=Clastoptera arizonana TaxID=38151 RepID=A0A1B6DFS1_9HEMI